MLTVDKTASSQKLIVTVTDNVTGQGNAFKLQINSPYTKKTYSAILEANISPYTSRYDEFELSSTAYTEWHSGVYTYAIYEHDAATSSDIKVLETGLLKVIGIEETQDEYKSISMAETADDFKVYIKS